jgi:hypothetical protein
MKDGLSSSEIFLMLLVLTGISLLFNVKKNCHTRHIVFYGPCTFVKYIFVDTTHSCEVSLIAVGHPYFMAGVSNSSVRVCTH